MQKDKFQIPNSRFQIPIRGFSLIEIMVVITIFAVLGIIVTSSVILTLAGAKKSESLIRVRDNLNYSLSVIERNIRNANSVPDCSDTGSNIISYLDQNGALASFSCITNGTDSYFASGSSRLTSNSIKIVDCSSVFKCTPSAANTPPLVEINVTVRDASSSGVQSSEVTAQTQIYLRNY